VPAIDRQLAATGTHATHDERERLAELKSLVTLGSQRARDRIAANERIALQAGDTAAMDYDFLYDPSRHLLAIGYNVAERRPDPSYYDLLASEARMSTFVAIAQGHLPQESWFALGRLLTNAGGEPVLLSWSGSMFEYLMPLLLMPTYENTLLDQTCKAAVARQIEYGSQRSVPWGISESGYNTTDARLNYQYRAFGVPGLGLKRGLAEDLVIAPYASALALMVAPEAACVNLQRLAADGLGGRYGFYAHLQPGSLRVKKGDRVKKGQVLALVGNSGNTTGPHLHFHVMDGLTALGAQGLPYLIDSFAVQGMVRDIPDDEGPSAFTEPLPVSPTPPRERRMQYPLENTVVDFPGGK